MNPIRMGMRRRGTRLLLAAVLVLPVAGADGRGAGAATKQVSGHFTASAAAPLACTGITCFATDFTGNIQGHAEHTLTNMFPSSTPPSVMFFNLLTVIHTSKGDLRCGESGASNPVVPSDGEFVLLCEISGGTGEFAGATGYLMRRGTSVGGLAGTLPGMAPTTGGGDYLGVIETQ